MKSLLIADTTREEREQIVSESIRHGKKESRSSANRSETSTVPVTDAVPA